MDFEEKQRLNRKQLLEFRKYLSDKNCEKCGEKPFGIARCKVLCRKHYKKIVADNKRKHEMGIDIPKDL